MSIRHGLKSNCYVANVKLVKSALLLDCPFSVAALNMQLVHLVNNAVLCPEDIQLYCHRNLMNFTNVIGEWPTSGISLRGLARLFFFPCWRNSS